jgi:malate dehydrogenase
VEGLPQGKALDLQEAMPIIGSDTRIFGTNDYKDTAESDLVILTAGLTRKPGMSRDELLITNSKIVREVVTKALEESPDAIFVILTNPLDTMSYLAMKVSGLPRERVIGQAGILDSARMRTFVSLELGVSVENVHCYVLGGHGDDMVPLPRHSNVAGVSLEKILPQAHLDAIIERTRKGGGEILGMMKTGSAFYAPSAAIAQMSEAILLDRHLIVPASAYLDGEYGQKGIFFGVPVQLGRVGIERIIEYELNEMERANLEVSANHVRELIQSLPL